MRTLLLVLTTACAVVALTFVGTAGADSPNTGCRADWTPGAAVSEDAQKRDRNGDGIVCAKQVNGQGNGDYLQPNVVVTDNNTPAAAG